MPFGRRGPATRAGLVVVLLALCGAQASAQASRTLVWSDEFEGPAGSAVDATKWVSEIGDGSNGWGNQERQYYTGAMRNASLDGAGHLVVTAYRETQGPRLRCWYGECLYTSARLKTQGKFQQAYGRFEARLKLPHGQGIWPAFWMLGQDVRTAGWPACGEIDIMENIGREPSIVHGTIHGPGYSGAAAIGAPHALAAGAFKDDFHVFAVEWEPKRIRWYVDGRLYQTRTPADLPKGATWVFDRPHFILLNLAVGGQWPGDPDQTTTFPQKMYVDYVRVYSSQSRPR